MLRLIITVVFLGLFVLPGLSQPSASWNGLTGLFTQPTAESIPPGEIAVTFSEIRFSQEADAQEVENIWYSGSISTSLSRRWEVALTLRHDVVDYFVDTTVEPEREIEDVLIIGDVKYIVTPPQGNHVGLAVGVMDITGATDELDGVDVGRGRRFFAVGSYRWAHFGLTHDDGKFGAYAGANWQITDNIDLIAEYVTEPTFVQLTSPQPKNTANFNLGARFYPSAVPGLRLDVAAVGDGKFNFGFSLSYRLHIR